MKGAVTSQQRADDRRRLKRMPVDSIDYARIAGQRVVIRNLSLEGAGIEHGIPFRNIREGVLEFAVNGRVIRVQARVVRSRLFAAGEGGRPVYYSGITFGSGVAEVREVIAELIAIRVQGNGRESAASLFSLATG